MKTLTVNGGIPLVGKIHVSGSKNAALPILFSSLITRGVSRISRVPDISDVRVAIKIIEDFGCSVWREGDSVYIDTRELEYCEPSHVYTSKIRASTYLLGSMLVRFGKCILPDFGGCNFSSRPIDLHVSAAQSFGAEVSENVITADRLNPCEINFPKKSVGATANAMILAAGTDGESVIRGHAREPHIMALASYLCSAGAYINITDESIVIRGGELHGGDTEIIGDMIEAGSYLASALVTDGKVGISGVDMADMAAFISFLESVGARMEIADGCITAERGSILRWSEIVALPYPEYPTDLQPIAAILLASLNGGKIYDKVFPKRFGYLDKLGLFGVKYMKDNDFAEIKPSNLESASVDIPDLRGGFACLLAALAAHGESQLFSPEILLRGYENLEKKLSSLGADVKFE